MKFLYSDGKTKLRKNEEKYSFTLADNLINHFTDMLRWKKQMLSISELF